MFYIEYKKYLSINGVHKANFPRSFLILWTTTFRFLLSNLEWPAQPVTATNQLTSPPWASNSDKATEWKTESSDCERKLDTRTMEHLLASHQLRAQHRRTDRGGQMFTWGLLCNLFPVTNANDGVRGRNNQLLSKTFCNIYICMQVQTPVCIC